MTTPPCLIMTLPDELLIPAARTASAIFPPNAPAEVAHAILSPQEVAVLTTKFWGPKPRVMGVRFLDNPTAAFRRMFLEAANSWDCGITFAETSGDGELRLSRDRAGYYSYIGTDNEHVPAGQHTMNLQGFTEFTSASEWLRVPTHEVGHFLGMTHEHRRRKFVDRIDRAKAYAYFLRWQGWGKQLVDVNVLTPEEEASLLTPTAPDDESVMAYPLPGEIMVDGIPVPGGPRINARDLAYVDLIYPKKNEPTPPVTPPPVEPPKPKPPVEPPKPTRPEPRSISVGIESRTFKLEPGGSVLLKFRARKRREYAAGARGDIPLKIALLDADGSTIGKNARVGRVLDVGTYLLEVSAKNPAQSGSFKVKVDTA